MKCALLLILIAAMAVVGSIPAHADPPVTTGAPVLRSGTNVMTGSYILSGSGASLSGTNGAQIAAVAYSGTANWLRVSPNTYLVFDGDSITGYGSPNYPSSGAGTSYDKFLLSGSAGNVFVGCSGTNIGVPGQDLAELMARYMAYVHPHAPIVTGTPAIYFVDIGTNDCTGATFNPYAYVLANGGTNTLEYLFQLARNDGFIVAATTITPRAPGTYSGYTPQFEVNRQILNSLILSDTIPQIKIDRASWFPNPWDPLTYVDGTHPTALANLIWAQNINNIFGGLGVPGAQPAAVPVLNPIGVQSASSVAIGGGTANVTQVVVSSPLNSYQDSYLTTSTLTADSGTGGNTLTNHGVTTIAGKIGTAGTFNGSSYLISGTNLALNNNSFSCWGWFKTTTTSSNQAVFDEWNYGSPFDYGWDVEVDGTQVIMKSAAASQSAYASSVAVSASTYYFAAFSYDATRRTSTLWVNNAPPVVVYGGADGYNNNGGGFYQQSPVPFMIGIAGLFTTSTVYPFNGVISDVQFGNFNLTASMEAALYNNGNGQVPPFSPDGASLVIQSGSSYGAISVTGSAQPIMTVTGTATYYTGERVASGVVTSTTSSQPNLLTWTPNVAGRYSIYASVDVTSTDQTSIIGPTIISTDEAGVTGTMNDNLNGSGPLNGSDTNWNDQAGGVIPLGDQQNYNAEAGPGPFTWKLDGLYLGAGHPVIVGTIAAGGTTQYNARAIIVYWGP